MKEIIRLKEYPGGMAQMRIKKRWKQTEIN